MQHAQDNRCLVFEAINQEVARRLNDYRLTACATQMVENYAIAWFGADRSTSGDS